MSDAHSQDDPGVARMPPVGSGRQETSIVPRNTIAGRALTSVVAIMTFLAALTTGGVALVIGSAADWQSEVAREVTIQVKPIGNRNVDADVARAVEIARAARGVGDVRPYTREESARLLEPWLGSGAALSDLPVPRIVVVRVKQGERVDLAALRTSLRELPTSTLDDHRGWIDRMRTMAGTAVAIGLAILGLVLTATMLSVAFATRGAMAANRPTIEVLHFIGATDGYIASQFQRHFLLLGLKGGLIGGGSALLLFAVASVASEWLVGTAGGDEAAALFGSLSIGWIGYAVIIAQIAVIAIVTAGTSREVVNRTLRAIA